MNTLLFNKPYRVLSQFTDAPNHRSSHSARKTLANFIERPQFYPAGRLDFDSEGLLLLTNDGRLQQRISDPAFKLEKHYWVQVEGTPGPAELAQLRNGVLLKDGMTLPARVQLIERPAGLWSRQPPVAEHREVSSSWLSIAIKEGRNRQVRRMCAAIGTPVLRLVRHRIGAWSVHLSLIHI